MNGTVAALAEGSPLAWGNPTNRLCAGIVQSLLAEGVADDVIYRALQAGLTAEKGGADFVTVTDPTWPREQ